MPIFEFTCEKCGKTYERWVKLSDDSLPTFCMNCGGKLYQVISKTSFILKGSGWEKDGYSNKGGLDDA